MQDNEIHGPASDGSAAGRGNTGVDRPDGGAPRRTTPWNTLSARVICFVSRKGGVGKTTSAINLGAAFALSGHTVLVVGVDPQCGVCRSLGCDPDQLDGRLLDVFRGKRSLVHVARTSPLKDLFYVAPGIGSLDEEDAYTACMQDEADTFVAEIDRARNLYDTILVDCPPNLGPTTRTALLAADSYLVPVQAEELCRDSLSPLLEFIETYRRSIDFEEDRLRAVEHTAARSLELEGLLLTMANQRTRIGRYVVDRVRADYGDAILETVIPRATRLSEMALRGKPAVIYDRRSTSSRAYFDLADELVLRYRERAGAELPHPHFTEHPATGKPAAAPAAETVATSTNQGPSGSEEAPAVVPGEFDRLLADMQTETVARETGPAGENLEGVEVISLSDLLAEEERHSHPRRDWEDDPWNGDSELEGRSN